MATLIALSCSSSDRMPSCLQATHYNIRPASTAASEQISDGNLRKVGTQSLHASLKSRKLLEYSDAWVSHCWLDRLSEAETAEAKTVAHFGSFLKTSSTKGACSAGFFVSAAADAVGCSDAPAWSAAGAEGSAGCSAAAGASTSMPCKK